MPSPSKNPSERRVAKRKDLILRVDLKVLPERDVENIMEGDGYPDLSIRDLAMTRPRSGMDGLSTLDVSLTGMGVQCKQVLEKGMATALDLHLPGERTVIKLLGEVMWSGEVEGAPRAGIRIAALDDDGARRFQGFLTT